MTSVYLDHLASRPVAGSIVPSQGSTLIWDDIKEYWKAGNSKPMVFVAASNATGSEKSAADYLCDGTNDNIEIQAAIDSLTNGGTVQLSSGTFTIGAQVTMSSTNLPVWLAGVSQGATILTAKNSLNATMILAGDADTQGAAVIGGIRDLTLTGNSANNSSGSGLKQQAGNRFSIINCLVTDFKEHGLQIDGVSGSYRSDYTLILNCWIYLNLKHGVYFNNPMSTPTLIGSFISDNGVATSSYDNVHLANSGEAIISGCHIWQGKRNNIYINQGGPNIVTGCTLNTPEECNIYIAGGAAGTVITGNSFQDCSNRSSGGYSHIQVESASGTQVTSNWFNDTSATTPKAVFEETGTSNYNSFVGNMLDNGAGVKTITITGANSTAWLNQNATTITRFPYDLTFSGAATVSTAAGNLTLTGANAIVMYANTTAFLTATTTTASWAVNQDFGNHTMKCTGLPAYAAGSHYVVMDASGNFQLSTLDPGA